MHFYSTIKIVFFACLLAFIFSACKQNYPKTNGLYIYNSYTIGKEYQQIKNFYVVRFKNKSKGMILSITSEYTKNDDEMIKELRNMIRPTYFKKVPITQLFSYTLKKDSIFFIDNQFAPILPVEYKGSIENEKIIFNYKILNPEHSWGKYAVLIDRSTTREFIFYPDSTIKK